MLNSPTSTPCGILYIDDEEKALKYFRMAFGQKYRVFTAASGPEGLELLRREAASIGIVISDQRMPGPSGAEVLGRVREEYPSIVRLLTTAYSDLESAIQAVNRGHIYQYVVKPWEIPDLGMVLQRAADYFMVTSERNGLLGVKMNVLQRIVAGDRVRGLCLAAAGRSPERSEAVVRALAALVAALPEDEGDLRVRADAFRPAEFAAPEVLSSSYEETLGLARALDLPPESPAALAAAFGADGIPCEGTGAGSAWTLTFPAGSDRAALRKILFGVLVAREVSSPVTAFFSALVFLADQGGSLEVIRDGEPLAVFSFGSAGAAPSEIIAALYQKYSQWDIGSR